MRIKIREEEISITTSDNNLFYFHQSQFKELCKAFKLIGDLLSYESIESINVDFGDAKQIYELTSKKVQERKKP